MRKLKLQVQLTLDGYVGTENGEQDWRIWNWDDKLKDFGNNLLNSCDTILLGRKFAEIFIPHFEAETFEYARIMVDTPKIVFSKTMKTFNGKNVSVENGDFVSAIKRLKSKEGKDILVHGGASFVSALIQEELIDEFNFFVNPVLINKGMRIFDFQQHRQKLSLVSATPYECGIAVLTYKI
jgi:dihydrofolate reductase